MEYSIFGSGSEITITKNLPSGDCLEVTMSLTFKLREDIDIDTNIISSMFHGYDSEHSVQLNDEQITDLTNLAYSYVNDNPDNFYLH